MRDDELDDLLITMVDSAGQVPDLTQGVWREVHQLQGRENQRRHAVLTLGVGVVAVISGITVAQGPAAAQTAPAGVFGELTNSPSNLLHVIP